VTSEPFHDGALRCSPGSYEPRATVQRAGKDSCSRPQASSCSYIRLSVGGAAYPSRRHLDCWREFLRWRRAVSTRPAAHGLINDIRRNTTLLVELDTR
jgi:hypothetical protein